MFVLAACNGGEQTGPASGAPSASPAPAPAPPPATKPAGSLSVTWLANAEPDLQGYRVYFGTAPGSYAQVRGAGLNAGATTEFTVAGLQAGTTYYVAVTAYDTSGNESAFSSELVGVAK